MDPALVEAGARVLRAVEAWTRTDIAAAVINVVEPLIREQIAQEIEVLPFTVSARTLRAQAAAIARGQTWS